MEKLKVVLDWFPNTNHIGFLIAQKRGWFAEAGLDVEIFGDVHGEMELHEVGEGEKAEDAEEAHAEVEVLLRALAEQTQDLAG